MGRVLEGWHLFAWAVQSSKSVRCPRTVTQAPFSPSPHFLDKNFRILFARVDPIFCLKNWPKNRELVEKKNVFQNFPIAKEVVNVFERKLQKSKFHQLKTFFSRTCLSLTITRWVLSTLLSLRHQQFCQLTLVTFNFLLWDHFANSGNLTMRIDPGQESP